MQAGDSVTIKPPFAEAFPGTYSILAPSEAPDTYKVDVYLDGIGSDFYIDFLGAA